MLDDDVQMVLSEIGAVILKRRKQKGLTVEELAEKSGVNLGLVSTLEAGKTLRHSPNFLTIYSILQVLDLQVSISISGPSVVAAVSQVIPELATMSDGRTEALDTALRAVAEAFVKAIKDSEVGK